MIVRGEVIVVKKTRAVADRMLTARLRAQTAKELTALASANGLTLSTYVRLVLEQHLRTPLKLQLSQ